MVIQDLNHISTIANTQEIEGSGSAELIFNLEFLSLGRDLSVAAVPVAEFLTTEAPNVAISSGKFTILLASAGA